jgi:hypothetical protein
MQVLTGEKQEEAEWVPINDPIEYKQFEPQRTKLNECEETITGMKEPEDSYKDE